MVRPGFFQSVSSTLWVLVSFGTGVDCLVSCQWDSHPLVGRNVTINREIALYVVQENFAASQSNQGPSILQTPPIVVRSICVNI